MGYTIGTCSVCPAPVIWAVTASNTPMPVDPHFHRDGNIVLSKRALGAPLAAVYGRTPISIPAELRFMPHWATCPNADLVRKPKASRASAPPPDDTLF